MTVVKMPQLGETVIEGTILKWLKQEGDQVALDEPLFEISTDKVDTEVPSSAAGVLARIMVAEGETVAVGTELAEIADGCDLGRCLSGRRLGDVAVPAAVARRGRRRGLGALRRDHGELRADLHRLALLDEDLLQHAAARRRHFGVDLVGRDLEQAFVGVDRLADLLEPLRDRSLGDGDAHLGHHDVGCACDRHQYSINSFSSFATPSTCGMKRPGSKHLPRPDYSDVVDPARAR